MIRLWADRWFKVVGLSHEIQTGNAEFDRKIYVACDHPAIASLLTKDSTVPATQLRLFTASTTKIYSDGATLWVKRSAEYPPGEETLRQLVAVRDALLAGRRQIQASAVQTPDTQRLTAPIAYRYQPVFTIVSF